jgi:Transposase DNA-binding/Transposase Tn5 dimerisation domain
MSHVEPSLARRAFASLDLGDRRRSQRLAALVEAMCRHPGGTLPDKLNEPCDLRAFYRLMDCERVTHAALITGIRQATFDAIAQTEDVVLLLHDATELDYTSKASLADHLGQIGQGTQRGYLCHNSLAVNARTGHVLGLAGQLLHHRADVPEGETDKERRERESRESRLWVKGVQAIGPAPAGTRVVDVSDSLSDTFEYMAYEVEQQREFVLRARENRKLKEAVAGQYYLFDAARALPAGATREVHVYGSATRRERDTAVRVAWAAVRIAAPRKRSGEYTAKELTLWVLRVWEEETPAGEEPLEWILLTGVAVADGEAAQERVRWYELRPIVEEFHKGKKTGCHIEGLQFTTIERLEPAIAVISLVATTLLELRNAARDEARAAEPARALVAEDYVEVVERHYARRVRGPLTVGEFYRLVARLGGHQNRKGDGFPGWITLWRGWTKLESMVDGFRAAHQDRSSCGKT